MAQALGWGTRSVAVRHLVRMEVLKDEVPQTYTVIIPEVAKLSGKYELLPDKNGDRPMWGSKNNRLYRTANRTWGITDNAADIPQNVALVRSKTKEADMKFPHSITDWEFFDTQKRVWGPSKTSATPVRVRR